jgi:hypothetical protein
MRGCWKSQWDGAQVQLLDDFASCLTISVVPVGYTPAMTL